MTDKITCPSCGRQIAVSETLATQIRQHLRQEFDQQASQMEQAVAKRLEDIRRQQRELETARLSMEEEVSKRVGQERSRLVQEAQVQAQESAAMDIRDLETQLTAAKAKIVEAHASELQLRKDRRELEERHRELELTVARTLDSERATIRHAAKEEAAEENRLKEADRERLIADLRGQIDDLKRRSEQGSPQARGEVMELELEDVLRDAFPHDTVEPIPVGAHGGDILQHVVDQTGLDCGIILLESKRTKNWSDAWLPKLRNDQRLAKAHVAILTSEELPHGLSGFGYVDGVWVTSRHCLLGLTAALRHGIIEAARTRRSLQGRRDKVGLLCNYLASSEFRQRIEGIVEAFMTLKEDLDSEKRSMHRLWAKREKQLERAALNTSGLYGDLAGILGPSLAQVASLELAVIAAESDSLALETAGNTLDESQF